MNWQMTSTPKEQSRVEQVKFITLSLKEVIWNLSICLHPIWENKQSIISTFYLLTKQFYSFNASFWFTSLKSVFCILLFFPNYAPTENNTFTKPQKIHHKIYEVSYQYNSYQKPCIWWSITIFATGPSRKKTNKHSF